MVLSKEYSFLSLWLRAARLNPLQWWVSSYFRWQRWRVWRAMQGRSTFSSQERYHSRKLLLAVMLLSYGTAS